MGGFDEGLALSNCCAVVHRVCLWNERVFPTQKLLLFMAEEILYIRKRDTYVGEIPVRERTHVELTVECRRRAPQTTRGTTLREEK